MKCLIEYEKYISDLWSGTLIGIGFEHKLILIHVYVLRMIHFKLTLDPKYPDEPNAAFTISILLIWISSLLKYEYLTQQDTMNQLG